MERINTVELAMFVKKAEKKKFKTLARGYEFLAKSAKGGICYIPNSTGKSRKHSFKYLDRVVKRFNGTGSFRPKDYVDITANASYTLTLINEHLKEKIR